ncbi:MAG: hypothetical protein ABIG11_09570 [bacterium]
MISTVVAHPSLASEIDCRRKYFSDRGVVFVTQPFIGRYDGADYPESYSVEELKKFGLRKNENGAGTSLRQGMLCNAGYNAFVVRSNGLVESCYGLSGERGNIYHNIVFSKDLVKCPAKRCTCPFPAHHKHLFAKALTECRHGSG